MSTGPARRSSRLLRSASPACAFAVDPALPGLIHHSDQGGHTSRWDSGRDAPTPGSPGRGSTGVCWDNTIAETFFATLKRELVSSWPTKPPTLVCLIRTRQPSTQTINIYFSTTATPADSRNPTPRQPGQITASVKPGPSHRCAAVAERAPAQVRRRRQKRVRARWTPFHTNAGAGLTTLVARGGFSLVRFTLCLRVSSSRPRQWQTRDLCRRSRRGRVRPTV